MADKQLDIDLSLIRDFVDESLDLLNIVEADLVKLENQSDNLDLINGIFRPIHSIKGNSPFFGLTNIRHLAHEMESLLDLLRKSLIIADNTIISLLLKGVDQLKTMLDRAKGGKPELIAADELALLDEAIKPYLESGKIATVTKRLTATGATEQESSSTKSTEGKRSIRVQEEHIDSFLSYVGELLVIGEMLSYLQQGVSDAGIAERLKSEFNRLNEAFRKLSNDLQRSIMSIRKQPLNNIFQKYTRIVRDIATNKGKEVKLTLTGEAIEVDKSILELLDAPLMHIVRNAVDHGIEDKKSRITSGKAVTGFINIIAEENDTQITIKVIDDGRGLDLPALRAKGIENGVIKPDGNYSDEEITQLIFMPGLSTAKEITDVSGRGVGMDVVKRAVEQAGGTISIVTVSGQGSTVSLTLNKSVSTQIIEGFVVEVMENCFVVPLAQVRETLHYANDQIQSVAGKGYFLERQGIIMPIIPLANSMSLRSDIGFKKTQLFVSVVSAEHSYALQVDEVIGVQQIVLKKIDLLDFKQDLFTGTALLGDGRLALVLDLDRLCRDFTD